MIYKDTLGGCTWCIYSSPMFPYDGPRSNHALALLQVNRQIHSEASLFQFAHNTFEGTHDGHLRTWLQNLRQDKRHAIRSIKVHERGYIRHTAFGLAPSESVGMNMRSIRDWDLNGLKEVEVELTLNPWSFHGRETELADAKAATMSSLKLQMEKALAGVAVHIYLKNERGRIPEQNQGIETGIPPEHDAQTHDT